MGDVNVARREPSCLPPKTSFVLTSRGVLNSPLLSSLKRGTGTLPPRGRMLNFPERMLGVNGDIMLERSGDI